MNEARCHYCGEVASTSDHIVPKHRVRKNLPGLAISHPFYRLNRVPACRPCNARKGNRFPTCDCERCREAVHAYTRLCIGLGVS